VDVTSPHRSLIATEAHRSKWLGHQWTAKMNWANQVQLITPSDICSTLVELAQASPLMQNPAFNELQKIELAEALFGIDFPVDVKVSVEDHLTLENPRKLVD